MPPSVGAYASWLREAHTGQGDRRAAGHSPKNLDIWQRWNYISVGKGWTLQYIVLCQSEKNEIESLCTSYRKIRFALIKEKLLEDSIGEYLYHRDRNFFFSHKKC